MKYYLPVEEILRVLDRASKGYIQKIKSSDASWHDKKFAFHAKITIDKIRKEIINKANE